MRLFKVMLALLSILTLVALLYFENQLSGYSLGITLVFYCLGSAVHLLVHECGHFIGGVISGYKLLCLQLGPMRIIKDKENTLKFQWNSSLSGQCIMIPRHINSVHFKAYNLGGAFANLVVVALSFALLMLNSFYSTLLFATFLCIGIQKILVNVVPHTTNAIPNDGYVVKLLNRDIAIQRDYAMYLELYGKLFLNEPISPQDYQYERVKALNTNELLYYNEIQQILCSLETESV